jgi:hypothetical protein
MILAATWELGMPFDIFVTRTSLPDREVELTASGWNFLPWKKTNTNSISVQEFAIAMQTATVRQKHADELYWLWHPLIDVPWCSVELVPTDENGGYIHFSISFGNNYFMRIWKDIFDFALRTAESLGARVVEGHWKEEVTRKNFQSVLDQEDEYYQHHYSCWRQTLDALTARNQAPLEYPIGYEDAVNEYFMFQVYPDRIMPFHQIVREMSLNVDSISTSGASFIKDDDGNPMTRFFVNADGSFVLAPAYTFRDFSYLATATCDIVNQFHNYLGGHVFFNQAPFTEDLKSFVQENSKGLGIEFYLIVNEHLHSSNS